MIYYQITLNYTIENINQLHTIVYARHGRELMGLKSSVRVVGRPGEKDLSKCTRNIRAVLLKAIFLAPKRVV